MKAPIGSTLRLKREKSQELLALLPQVWLEVHQVRLAVVGVLHYAVLPPIVHAHLVAANVRRVGASAKHQLNLAFLAEDAIFRCTGNLQRCSIICSNLLSVRIYLFPQGLVAWPVVLR